MPIKLSTPKPKEAHKPLGKPVMVRMPYEIAKILMESDTATLEQLKKLFKLVLDRNYYAKPNR